MANLTEVSQWENVIRQLENGEAATGGADGLANVQAKQLANRTQWLKENYLPLTGGVMSGAVYGTDTMNGLQFLSNQNKHNGARLNLNDCINSDGSAILNARNTERACQINIQPNGEVLLQHYEGEASTSVTSTHDLAGAAIVAKYYNAETEIGYVKFVNGLLYQWGVIKESTTSGIVSMPLSYDKGYVVCAVNNADTIVQDEIDAVSAIPQTKQKFKYTKRYNNYWLNWFAIGRV